MSTGVTGAQALLAAALLTLALLPPGYWVTRELAPGLLTRGERLLLSALVGYPVACAALYLLELAGAAAAFLPASGALAVLALCRRRRARAAAAHQPGFVWAVAAFSLALLFSLASLRAFVPAAGGALRYEHSVDHSLFLSFYWELLRGVPPAQLPTAAGVPFPAYHLLAMMPGLLLIQQAGLAPALVSHAIVPLFRLLLFAGALGLAVRLRSGDLRTAAAALLAAFVAGAGFEAAMNDRVVVGPPPLYDFLRNEPTGGGLVLWATIFCLLALWDRARAAPEAGTNRRLLLTASSLAGLSYAFKAQLFLLFGGAYAAALALLWLRARARLYLEALAALGLTFAVFYVLSRGTQGGAATLQLTPGLFAELYIYPNLRRDPWPALHALADFFANFPAGLGYLLAVPLAVWRVVAFSPLVPVFLALAVRDARRLGFADAVAALSLLLALPMGFFLSVTSIYEDASPYEFRQAAHGLAFLGAAVSVIALHALLRKSTQDPGPLMLGVAGVASALALPALLGAASFVPARAAITLSPDEQCALVFLRTRTPPDAVVLSARTEPGEDVRRLAHRLNHQAVVAGFGGRRSVLEYYGREVDIGRDRERDIKRFFTTDDAELGERILERYAVDYVVESDALPLQFPTRGLATAFERGAFRIHAYSARARGGLLMELPRAFQASDGLCADGVGARR